MHVAVAVAQLTQQNSSGTKRTEAGTSIPSCNFFSAFALGVDGVCLCSRLASLFLIYFFPDDSAHGVVEHIARWLPM